MKPSIKPTLPWWRQRAITLTIAILGLFAVLITVNSNIIKYENHLATGSTVLLALAPVDPRGFMQGDYMALSYAIEQDILTALSAQQPNHASEHSDPLESNLQYPNPSQGYVIVKLDANSVGHFVRLADSSSRTGLAKNELPIYYRIRDGQVRLATNAFFFQEGHAKPFEAAKYGLFRVNDKGAPLLTQLVNEDFQVIEGEANPTDTLNR